MQIGFLNKLCFISILRRGKRTAKRWYQAPHVTEKQAIGYGTADGFDSKLPAEWESWLRHRR